MSALSTGNSDRRGTAQVDRLCPSLPKNLLLDPLSLYLSGQTLYPSFAVSEIELLGIHFEHSETTQTHTGILFQAEVLLDSAKGPVSF